MSKTSKLNRVEVIDHTKSVDDGGGRVYVKWEDDIKVSLLYQDDNRTLKVVINPKSK